MTLYTRAVSSKSKRGKVTGTFALVGTILGAAIGYFATDGVPMWIAFGAVAGGLAGYIGGRYFDREGN